MAYKFVDTIEEPGAEEMPAEAMKINGEYIENQMDSRYCTYRTLYVKGREMLSPELSTYTTGVHDGSALLNKKFPERIITIGYKLQANSNYWFRIAYNELNKILNVEDAEIIFYDEQDKYFTGTPQGLGNVDPGTNFVTGEFEILCNDPFKYSVTEYEAEPESDGTFVIDYNGTYKSFPTLEADFYEESECGDDGSTPTTLTSSGDCGYVAWFDEDANIIQLGDPEEEDTESYAKSQTLVNQSWKQVTGWTEALNSLWIKNNGYTTSGFTSQQGTLGFPLGSVSGNLHILHATDYGTDSSGHHGPTVTRMVPTDASGETGAVDWTCKWSLKMCIGNSSTSNKERGMFQCCVYTDTGRRIAGMSVWKTGSGTTATIRAYVNNKTMKDVSIDISYRNKYFGHNSVDGTYNSIKTCTITKAGSTVTMNLGGVSMSFTDSGIKDLVATSVTQCFGQYKDYPAFTWMGVYSFSFVKNNCTTWADIPNKFTLNDVAVAECQTGKVYLNGTEHPEYGALGNNWETFCLTPGYNQIGFSYSDWCEIPPTPKVMYREVYL